jgi:hypothetical protein
LGFVDAVEFAVPFKFVAEFKFPDPLGFVEAFEFAVPSGFIEDSEFPHELEFIDPLIFPPAIDPCRVRPEEPAPDPPPIGPEPIEIGLDDDPGYPGNCGPESFDATLGYPDMSIRGRFDPAFAFSVASAD